jgi:hypothetical protein
MTVKELERRKSIKKTSKKKDDEEPREPRLYDTLPNQFEDENGDVPEFVNGTLDRIRRNTKNLIGQVW